ATGFRKTPSSAVSALLEQRSFVEAWNTTPKELAAISSKEQKLRPGRSGTASPASCTTESVALPPLLQLPSPPEQRKSPCAAELPEIVDSNTTPPASVICASERRSSTPVPGSGTGSPTSATTVGSPRKIPLRPNRMRELHATTCEVLIVSE